MHKTYDNVIHELETHGSSCQINVYLYKFVKRTLCIGKPELFWVNFTSDLHTSLTK